MAPKAPLTTRQLNRATLARQGLLEPLDGTAAAAIARVGSIQAQHPEWPPIALAARVATPATADLSGALDRREAVRSSLMRITIHVVATPDFWPMFAACQPLRQTQWAVLTKVDPWTSELGASLLGTHGVAVAALHERPMSSLEIDRLLSAEIGLAEGAYRRPAWREPETTIPVRVAWRHFAAFVPLVHVPHEGEGYGRSRYALAEEWLGGRRPATSVEDARVHVARRYLAAFGPASVEDLAAYVGRGRGIGPWRRAIDAIGDELVELEADDGRRLVDLVDAPRPDGDAHAPPRFLARWDSLLLSHAARHRQRVIADEDRDAVFTRNADVLPTFLVDGFVSGTWQLTGEEDAATISIRPFRSLDAVTCDQLVAEGERLLALMAPKTVHRNVDVVRRPS